MAWLITDRGTKAINQNYVICVERENEDVRVLTIDETWHNFNCHTAGNAKKVFEQIISNEQEETEDAGSKKLSKPEPAWRTVLGE